MKAIVTADIHLHPFRQCSNDGGRDRLSDGLSALDQSVKAAQEHQVPWIFLGDLKHVKGLWNQQALNEARRILCETYKDVPKLLVHGNHDGLGGGTGLLPFRTDKNIVVAEPGTVYFQNEPFLVWPHGVPLEMMWDKMVTAKRQGVKIMLGHLFVSNSVVGKTDRPLVQGITLEQMWMEEGKASFEWAFLGDVHKRQVVPGSKHVLYPGSPLALNWGETEDDKGIMYVDTTSQKKIQLLPITAPRFREVDISGGTYNDDIAKQWEGDFVKLIISAATKPAIIDEYRRKSKARWFKAIIVRQKADAETRSEIHAGMTPGQIVDEYIRVRPPATAISAQTLRFAGLKLLEGQ